MFKLLLNALLVGVVLAPTAVHGQVPPPPPPPAVTPPPATPPPPAVVPPGVQTPPPTGQRGGRGSVAPPTQGGRGQQPGIAVPPNVPAIRGRWEPPAQNVRIEVTISDAAERTTKKVVSMLVADGDNGRIRSGNNQGVLNVDGQARVADDGRIYVSITIEYMPDRSLETTTLNESISLVLAAGKPTLVSQSADPGTDRRVTVEVTATVVK